MVLTSATRRRALLFATGSVRMLGERRAEATAMTGVSEMSNGTCVSQSRERRMRRKDSDRNAATHHDLKVA